MIIRATFANTGYRGLAERIQDAGLSGTTFPSYVAGDWGVEHGSTAEFALPLRVDPGILDVTLRMWAKGDVGVMPFVVRTLRRLDEQAAYVTVDGARAFLVWSDGRVDEL